MPSFNLVDQPWLPALMQEDGQIHELGLRDTLARADEIRELADPSPLVTVSLHRLLLAVLHRLFGPATFEEWAELWERRSWDAVRIGTYCQQWRHRFDLFDPERPFYQVSRMADVGTLPPSVLAQEWAAGNNPTLFDHKSDVRPAPITPAQAARYLVAQQAFAIGGGVSKPFNLSNGPLATGLSVLATGANLFETLALNLLEYGRHTPQLGRAEDDRPAWEQDQPPAPRKEGTIPRGRVDYLTWQSRRFHLIAEGDPPLVVGVQRLQNLKLDSATLDPFKAYRANPQQGWAPRRLDPSRAVWRDSHALLQQVDNVARLEVINWLARVEQARCDEAIAAEASYGLMVFGLGADDPTRPANVALWRAERLPLPLAYTTRQELLDKLKNAIELAEGVEGALQAGARMLARLLIAPESDDKNARQPDRNAVAALARHLAPTQHYWAALETSFRQLLVDLADDESVDEEGAPVFGLNELPRWREVLRTIARDAFRAATSGLDLSARSLKALASAERVFARRLSEALGPVAGAPLDATLGEVPV